MNVARHMRSSGRSRGFTLVELMVAMTLGLVVLGAVGALLVNTKKTYVIQDSLARLQENARFATQFIARDLRMAGYFGCADEPTATKNLVNDSPGYSLVSGLTAIEGYEQNASAWQPSGSTDGVSNIAAGTDAITIRMLDGSKRIGVVAPPMPTESAAIHVEVGNGLAVGEIVAVSDCQSTDIFQITGPDDPDTSGTINHNTGAGVSPGNSDKDLSKTYDTDAFIMRFRGVRYYIGTGASGNPALFRETVDSSGSPTAEELVEGIENMQILYGQDLDDDQVPDVYKRADQLGDDEKAWSRVVAVRVVLLAYSIAAETESGQYAAGADTGDYDLGFSGSAADTVSGTTGNRKRRRFASTILVRNRQ